MSLLRYGEYKTSGLDWVRQVPSHWRLTKTKYVCQFSTGWTPPTGDAAAYQGENLWATISDLGERTIFRTAKRISDSAALKSRIDLVPVGSLMFSFKLSIGQVSFTGLPMYTNEAIASFRESSHLSLSFAYYAFPLFLIQNAAENIYGAKLLNQELIRGASFALPALEEQTAIAAFLDRETAKIDALIAEQTKLIALLAEKRQASIFHAVTKGLNPNTPMKDSGVVWLGEVPAHWNVSRVKRVSQFTTSGPRGWSERIAQDGSLFIQSGDLNETLGLELDTAKRVNVGDDAEAARTRLVEGDVVVCITGAKTGNVAHCMSLREPAYVNQHLCLIRPTNEVLGRFLAFALKSSVGQTQFELSQYGLKQGLSLENVRELIVAHPSLEEQGTILSFLEATMTKYASLSRAAEAGVSLLRERRNALIAAAVTGKIDVRSA
ncbi:restriction endonuclease subunit S [Achromobacter denitrificans]